jgi:hypothetical protein
MSYDDRLADYVDVAERIRIFREQYPTGSLQPVNPAEPFTVTTIGERTYITYTAAAYRTPDDPRPGIGVAWEPFPGRTPYTKDSEAMVAETSAWGRAIVAALAADTKRIASRDEVQARREQKQERQPAEQAQPAPKVKPRQEPATEPQERALYALSKKLEKLPPAKGTLTKAEAGTLIDEMQRELEAKK